MRNVGEVARLLNSYYGNDALEALANNNERAATVQAWIWFFTTATCSDEQSAVSA